MNGEEARRRIWADRMARGASVALAGITLATASVAFARNYCVPRVGRAGTEVLVCSTDDQICAEWNVPGDECMGMHRSASCTERDATFCFAVEEPAGHAELECFATLGTCRDERTYAWTVQRLATSPCVRTTREPPYRMLNRTVAPPPLPSSGRR